MKKLFIILLFFVGFSLSAQNKKQCYEIEYHKVNNREYALFPMYSPYMNSFEHFVYYTKLPSIEDVVTADSLAFIYISNLKTLENQGFDGCPIIKDNYEDYYRQAIVFLKKKSKNRYVEVLQIKYIHKKAEEKDREGFKSMSLDISWDKDWCFVSGGCSSYFDIFYDLEKKKVIDFTVN